MGCPCHHFFLAIFWEPLWTRWCLVVCMTFHLMGHMKRGGGVQLDSLETKLLFSQGYEEGLFRIFTCRSSKGTCVCLHLLWTQKLFLSFTAGLWMILDGDLECKIASIFALNGIVCWHIYLWRKKNFENLNMNLLIFSWYGPLFIAIIGLVVTYVYIIVTLNRRVGLQFISWLLTVNCVSLIDTSSLLIY